MNRSINSWQLNSANNDDIHLGLYHNRNTIANDED